MLKLRVMAVELDKPMICRYPGIPIGLPFVRSIHPRAENDAAWLLARTGSLFFASSADTSVVTREPNRAMEMMRVWSVLSLMITLLIG